MYFKPCPCNALSNKIFHTISLHKPILSPSYPLSAEFFATLRNFKAVRISASTTSAHLAVFSPLLYLLTFATDVVSVLLCKSQPLPLCFRPHPF